MIADPIHFPNLQPNLIKNSNADAGEFPDLIFGYDAGYDGFVAEIVQIRQRKSAGLV